MIFRGYEIASETLQFWANTMLLGGQTTEFHMNAILAIASYTNGVGLPIQFAGPFAGELARLTVRL